MGGDALFKRAKKRNDEMVMSYVQMFSEKPSDGCNVLVLLDDGLMTVLLCSFQG